MDFFRFPHVPHLARLGSNQPRDDKLLTPSEAHDILADEITVEEKIDGANTGLSVDENGVLCVQNRGGFLSAESCHPQFKPLFRWLALRRLALIDALYPDLMLFGEWCFAVHGVRYTKLPDWFLAFDVYDRRRENFWSVERRNRLVQRLGLARVPTLGVGRFDMPKLQLMLGKSQFGDALAEGLHIRRDDGDWLAARAKLVRPEFSQSIDLHWSQRKLERNLLAEDAAMR